MHVVDPAAGVYGTTAIVGGSIPLAVGAALAFHILGNRAVAVAIFGDGASEEGSFHESLNLAALKRLPVIFVLENNFYATCSPLTNRRACGDLYKHGEPYGIFSTLVDGNNVTDVNEAAVNAVIRARSGGGPSLLECRTYRWKGHVGPECDLAKGYRSAEELKQWKARCPVENFRARLTTSGVLTAAEDAAISRAAEQEIEAAFTQAKAAAFPPPEHLLTNVW